MCRSSNVCQCFISDTTESQLADTFAVFVGKHTSIVGLQKQQQQQQFFFLLFLLYVVVYLMNTMYTDIIGSCYGRRTFKEIHFKLPMYMEIRI